MRITLKRWPSQGRVAKLAEGRDANRQDPARPIGKLYPFGKIRLTSFLSSKVANFSKTLLSECLHHERNILPKLHVSWPRALGWAMSQPGHFCLYVYIERFDFSTFFLSTRVSHCCLLRFSAPASDGHWEILQLPVQLGSCDTRGSNRDSPVPIKSADSGWILILSETWAQPGHSSWPLS